MNLFELTRALVDIESTTNREQNVADFLFAQLSALAASTSGRLERMAVEPNRDNIFAWWGEPIVTLSTHMDTVPPFFPSLEDAEFIWGRGSCDAKGIIAAMIGAAEKLLDSGATNFGLLFVVGEERNSAGAKVAALNPRGARFLINGEPTENLLALGSKGALRFEITAHGKLAHSAYPELGHSAIHSLLDVLRAIRMIDVAARSVAGAMHAEYRDDSGGTRAERCGGSCAGGDYVSHGGRPGGDSQSGVGERLQGAPKRAKCCTRRRCGFRRSTELPLRWWRSRRTFRRLTGRGASHF